MSLTTLLPLAMGQRIHAEEFTLMTGANAFETIAIDLPVAPINSESRLEFDFGFSTSESIEPGLFADSITFTLSSPANQVAYIATTDVNGTLWTPSVPGGLSIESGSIQFSEIAYPNAPYATSFAYSISFDIPTELQGQPLSLGFSLFNNQDQLASEAFLRNPVVIVPEPGVTAMMALGVASLLFFHRRFSQV
ncbi:MAG: PEP-CTERM sorting domain-containing protein [Verrucomicrobiales bacterium]